MCIRDRGKDAQPEVKKENGKWYLWNGTEFEEFAGATPATNVPYYYADPTDPTTTLSWLFVTKTVRMKNLFVCP